MTTTETKQNNIIFIDGKEKGLKTLFSQDNFGYLAVGHSQSGDTNGFINVPEDDEVSSNGFNEVSVEEDSTYMRVPLVVDEEAFRNYDNGEVTVRFTAELDVDNIISGITIDQLAICDTQTPNDPSTTFYAAATCVDGFNKTEQLALVFVIEVTI